MCNSVTPLKQLSLAEFSWPQLQLGALKKFLGLCFFAFEGQKQGNSDFQSPFSISKNDFKKSYIEKGAQFLLLTYFHNFDFECTLFSKSVPNF